MKLHKVNTCQGLDFYVGQDKLEKRPIYNIVPEENMPPRSGYFSAEYIAKLKKTSASHFFPPE